MKNYGAVTDPKDITTKEYVDEKIPYGGVIQNTNPFGGKKLYLNTLDNALAGANVKYFVKATLHKKVVDGVNYPKPINPTDITLPQWEDSPVVSDVSLESNNLFDNNYENGIVVFSDSYLKVSLDFNQDGTDYFSGYPYGTYFLSYYYTDTPNSAQVRCYNGFQPHTIGYKTLGFTDYAGSIDKSGFIQQCTDTGNYYRRNIEFIVFGNSNHRTLLTQIEWKLLRPKFASNTPLFSNYGDNKSYRKLTLGTNLENKIILNNVDGSIVSNGQSVVLNNDERLSNSRPASDVYPWAKQQNKPTYTASEVGLGNVNNTSDLNKPISTATQNALNLKADKSSLSTVATTGQYSDLLGKPSVGNSTVISPSQPTSQNIGDTWYRVV